MKEFIKKYKIWIIVAVVLVIAIVLYSRYNKKKNLAPIDTAKTPSGSPPPATTTKQINDGFPLVKSSYGPNVQYLQRALNKIKPDNPVKVDGDFGNETYNKLLLTINTQAYPVTEAKFNEILNKANNS